MPDCTLIASSKTGGPELSRMAKALTGCFFVSLWLLVVALALEVFSRAAEVWTQRRNDYLMGRKDFRFPIAPESPFAGTECCWDGTSGFPLQPISIAPLQHEGGTAWRQSFEALSETERHLAASVHDENVLAYDRDGRLLEAYGLPTAKQLLDRVQKRWSAFPFWKVFAGRMIRDLDAGIADALQGHAVSREIRLGPGNQPERIHFVPGEGNQRVFVYLPNLMALISRSFGPLPEGSAWDVAYYRYRKNVPNTHGHLPGTFRLNNAGFRGKDVALPKPAGVFRIVCVGGSTTEEGGSDETTYPALLEKKLQAEFPERRIEVVNCGISGMNTLQQLSRFGDYLALQPDLLIVYEGVNDAAHLLPQEWLLLDTPPWAAPLYVSHFFRSRYPQWLYWTDQKLRESVESLVIDRFRVMKQFAADRGAAIAFCSIACPPYNRLSDQEQGYMTHRTRGFARFLFSPETYVKTVDEINLQLKGFCRNEKCFYIPIAENLQQLGYFVDFCHLCPEGIERKADMVFQCLRNQLRSLFLASTSE